MALGIIRELNCQNFNPHFALPYFFESDEGLSQRKTLLESGIDNSESCDFESWI